MNKTNWLFKCSDNYECCDFNKNNIEVSDFSGTLTTV